MAKSNRDRVGESLELLNKGLLPFVQRELKAVHGAAWEFVVRDEQGDVEKLLAELSQAGHRRISRPTVYRGLEQLVEAGLLRKMDLGGRAVYEHDYGYPSHDHLHCKECNRLIEFHSDEIERIRDAVARQQGFRVTGHRLIISGVCSDCNQKLRRKKSKLDLV